MAHQWGFADQSHFSRLFREAFGVSPREVRQAAGGIAAPADPARLPHYVGWLHRLPAAG